MLMSPKVSVIMPNFNHGQYIDVALNSIWNQVIPVHEVIIIDNGSTDMSLSIIQEHLNAGRPIKLIKIPRCSPALARNIGFEQTSGDFIAFLDADDLWPVYKLGTQLAFLDNHPENQMVTGYICYFEKSNPEGTAPAENSKIESIFHVHVGACLYKKACFSTLEYLFDPELRFGEDVDLLLRVRELNIPFTILRKNMLYYRVHPDSMMSNPDPRKASDFSLATFKSLKRRRSSGKILETLPDFSSFLESDHEPS
jgi:glycosyltransferase involved in cell wall biosynthesis